MDVTEKKDLHIRKLFKWKVYLYMYELSFCDEQCHFFYDKTIFRDDMKHTRAELPGRALAQSGFVQGVRIASSGTARRAASGSLRYYVVTGKTLERFYGSVSPLEASRAHQATVEELRG